MEKRVELKRRDDRGEPSRVEFALMVVGAAVTVGLLTYLLWRALTVPAAALPQASVIEVVPGENETLVRVQLMNRGGVGLQSVKVEVPCETPAPTLTFQIVPSGGFRTGTVSCPVGTTDPEARVTSWIPA